PGHLVADVRRDHQDRSRRELSEREAVDELLRCEPVRLADHLLLDERDHREAAAEGERTDLEEEQADLCEARRRWVGRRWNHERSWIRHRPCDAVKNEKTRRQRDEDGYAELLRAKEPEPGTAGEQQDGDDAQGSGEGRGGGRDRDHHLRAAFRGSPTETIDGDEVDAQDDGPQAVQRVAKDRRDTK